MKNTFGSLMLSVKNFMYFDGERGKSECKELYLV